MAFELIDHGEYPGLCASNIGDKMVVAITTGERGVVPVIAATTEPLGITIATGLRTEGVAVVTHGNVAKALAVGASGTANWRVGKSVTAAAAGEVFSVYVTPAQMSGLA